MEPGSGSRLYIRSMASIPTAELPRQRSARLARCQTRSDWRNAPLVTGPQIIAARALLGLSQEDLAHRADLPLSVLQDIEARHEKVQDDEGALEPLRLALESAGIAFIDERATSSAGGPGVRLAAPQSASVDTNAQETVQYPEMAKNGPLGAGG